MSKPSRKTLLQRSGAVDPDGSDGFNELLDTFCSQLSRKGLEILKTFCEKNELIARQHVDVDGVEARHLIDNLVEFGIINPDNLQLLSFVSQCCGQHEIRTAVETFELSRPSSNSSRQQLIQVPGYRSVKVIVKSQLGDMDRANVKSLCKFLADISCIQYHDLSCQGLSRTEGGCVEVDFLLPNRSLPTLQVRLDEQNDTFPNVGIVHIEIEQDVVIVETESASVLTPVQALLKHIGKGKELSASDIVSAVGASMSQKTIDLLLSQAAKHSNAVVIDEISQLIAMNKSLQQGNVIELMLTKAIQISLKLLPNAYAAGRDQLVRCLLHRGFLLHPTVESYTALLFRICSKKDYPRSMLESLLEREGSIELPFQDCSQNDAYERCVATCCVNNRSDLVELFLQRGVQLSQETFDRHSSCILSAMSSMGAHYYKIRGLQGFIKCVDINWQKKELHHVNVSLFSWAANRAYLVRLDLSRNQLVSLPSCLLDGTLPWLEEVDCSYNKLKSIWNKENRTSTEQHRLKVLNASRNKLAELPIYVFQIASLEDLDVSHNELATLPGPDVLSDSSSLTDSDCNETMENMWLCTRLKELNISHNCLSRLPETFGYVLHLRKLDVSHNELSTIPQSLAKAGFLEQVKLSDNQLGKASISNNLASLPKSIQKLSLARNRLGCIPLAVVSITNLRWLDFTDNAIASLPYKNQWNLPHLNSLILRNNNLTGSDRNMDFPDSFSRSLTHLDVSHNQLKKFPESLLLLKMAVCFNLQGNPRVDSIPPAIATLRRLWEVKVDDMKKAIEQFQPKGENVASGAGSLHYSKVKDKIRDTFYDYGLYYGIKMAVSGSRIARESVIKGLHYQPGQDSNATVTAQSLVSNLIFRRMVETSALSLGELPLQLGELAQWIPIANWFNKEPAVARDTTVKLWNVPNNRTLLVLQRVFFTENTVYLLVWHESDGLSGLDNLEETLQLMRTNAKSIRRILVLLTSTVLLPDVQTRINKLEKSPELSKMVHVSIRAQKTVLPLPEEIQNLAEELAGISEDNSGEDNRVPAAFRSAAKKLFFPETAINMAVCSRQLIEDRVFPKGFSDPDDFVRAMRFLMRIGALLHFEDTPRNLHEYFFPSAEVVSQVIVALTDGSSNHLSSSVAHNRHIYAILNRVTHSEANSNALYALLVKAGVVSPLDCCQCLLPFRLPRERNGMKLTLSQYLVPSDGDGDNRAPTYARRLYSIGGLPHSFWGRFISALVLQIQQVLDSLEIAHAHQAKTNAVFWVSGILASYDEGCFVVNAVMPEDPSQRTIPIENSKRCVESGLDIVVFDRRRRFIALGLICSHVDALLQEWIDSSGEDVSSPLSAYMTVMSVERLVPCPPFDLNSTHSSDEILYDFIFEHAVPRQAKLLTLDECLLSGSSLDTVPDLTLASLSHSERLSVDDVTMDVSSASRLGRGSFANVFPGYIGNEKVAFKIFGDVINLQLAAQHDQPLEQLQQMQQSHEVASPVVDENRDVHIFSFDDRTSKEGREEVGNELSNVKKLRLPPLGPLQYFKNLRDLVQEVSVMKRLQHTHIARFRAVLLKPYPCLVMEFAPAGNLATLITKRRDEIGTVTDLLTGDHFSDRAHDGIVGRQLTHRIAFQIALGIEYLHSKDICHLDLKPSNVLVFSDSLTAPINVKITDYGISCTVTAAGVNNALGTLGFQAPEQILSRKSRGESFDLRVDIYSYGMMMYHLLTGVHPFERDMDNPSMVEHRTRQSDHPPLPTGQSLVHLQSLIERCWRYWPGARPPASGIVAEMCEPSFFTQCEDLAIDGQHRVVASAVFSNQQQIVGGDVRHTMARRFTEGSRSISSMWSVPETTRHARPVRSVSMPVSRPHLASTNLVVASPTHSLKHSLSSASDTSVESSTASAQFLDVPNFPDVPNVPGVLDVPDVNLQATQSMERSASSGELPERGQQELDRDASSLLSLALVTTTDSLLVADPRYSQFLSWQKLDLAVGDVSAVMFLNDKLWVGRRCKQLSVFDCIGSEVVRRIKRQSFGCNDVVQDIQCDVSSDQSHAKVFALLANGDLVVVYGRQYQENSNEPRLTTEWGKDSLYRWNQPEVRRVANSGLEEDDASRVHSCMVFPREGELWYCQGNSIVLLDTTKSPEEVIWVDKSVAGDIVVQDVTPIRDAVVLEDSVWCYGGNLSDTLCEIDVPTRAHVRSWKMKDLRGSEATRKAGELHTKNRWCLWKRLAMSAPKSFQCMAAVYDTIWMACDNGAILVVSKEGDELRVLATLWCRSVLSHVLSQKRAAWPTVVISRMRQAGDRVLVYSSVSSSAEKVGERSIICEVYEARRSSNVKELTAYYNIHDA